MIDNLLNTKIWTAETNGKLFKALEEFEFEDRCSKAVEVAKELISRGDKQNISSAEVILVYATQKYFDVCDSNCKAEIYLALGELYEHHIGNYVKMFTYYEKYTLNNTLYEGNNCILLKAIILRDDFTYSDELETYLNRSLGEIDLGLRNDRLYESLGHLIVAQHNGDEERVKMLSKRLKSIVKTDEIHVLDLVFKKDKLPDRVNVPQKVLDYIESL